MTSTFIKAGIAALIALTGLTSTVTTAAASPEFGIYQIQYRDRDRDYRDWRPDRRPDHRRGGCAPWQAERKADRMGLRRTRVIDVSRRAVTVAGMTRRGPDRVVFANVRGCPLIRR